MEGMIFDIQRFAIHDGPGIRTSIFLKGCPLHCLWCHNPEGQSSLPQLVYFFRRCIGCHRCISNCPEHALSIGLPSGEIYIDRKRCTLCGNCTYACPTTALSMEGRKMSTGQVFYEIIKDVVYYDVSGGGITITGGEPLFQPEFTLEIAKESHEAGLNIVLETSGYSDFLILDQLRRWVDLFMIDIKAIYPTLHKEWTGVSNESILDNIKRLCMTDANIFIRVPLIPEYTANIDNLIGIADFVARLPRKLPCELLNFNPLARNKYKILGKEYGLATQSNKYSIIEMQDFAEIFRDRGLVAIWS